MKKTVRSDEMAVIAQKQRERRLEPGKKACVFRLRGTIVPQEKIERWKARTNYQSPSPHSPGPLVSKTPLFYPCILQPINLIQLDTPDGLSYWTASSDRGSVPTSPAATNQMCKAVARGARPSLHTP